MLDYITPVSEDALLLTCTRAIEFWLKTDRVAINRSGWPSFAVGALQEYATWTKLYTSVNLLGAKDKLQESLLKLYIQDEYQPTCGGNSQ